MIFADVNDMFSALVTRREQLAHLAPSYWTVDSRQKLADDILTEGTPLYIIAQMICSALYDEILKRDIKANPTESAKS